MGSWGWKTAIIEGLAQKIISKNLPRVLHDKRVMSLDISSIVAGTKYRGQFEERLESLMLELEKNNNIIIFIDEVHVLVGAGSAAGSLDASNMFKPALARGEIHCIGATTMDEYRKNIEKDGALIEDFKRSLFILLRKKSQLIFCMGLKKNIKIIIKLNTLIVPLVHVSNYLKDI